jgi:hypothetical protein
MYRNQQAQIANPHHIPLSPEQVFEESDKQLVKDTWTEARFDEKFKDTFCCGSDQCDWATENEEKSQELKAHIAMEKELSRKEVLEKCIAECEAQIKHWESLEDFDYNDNEYQRGLWNGVKVMKFTFEQFLTPPEALNKESHEHTDTAQ